MKFYVYELINPLTNKVFYVGKGTAINEKFRYRLAEHIKDAKNARLNQSNHSHKTYTILKILDANEKPTMNVLFETNNEQEALDIEIELIKY